jgi:cytochrome c556
MIRKLTAAVLVTTALAVGAGSAAFAAPATPNDPAAQASKIADRCAKAPEVIAKIKAVEAKVADRVAKLEAAKTKATEHGNTKLAEKIADRIGKLKQRAQQGLDRVAKIEAKVAEKCPAA